ncbi:replication initiator protein A [Fictibacillus enclensis]|uniref:replication initiator protein A n=1 Tax=Fictibacillus enclensis TaxID=1017270 RepID=UPI0024C03CB5|nr:replication initiator protein A [Fictibacillus enclensis]WHY74590.1 replication initiator protein A [Fictibacillus enclensis]
MDKSLSVTQSFVKLPKVFKGNKHYKGLSSDAKIVYSYSLDTLQLSKLNHASDGTWFDYEHKQHFIFYSVVQVMEDMECGKQKAINIRKELEKYGLWEMKSQGANKPTKIFVNEIIPSQAPKKPLRYTVKPRKEVLGVTVDGKELTDYAEVF